MRRKLVFVLKLAVAAGLLVWLFASGRIDLRQLANMQDRWPWFALAQVPFGIVMLLATFRWRLLLRAQGIQYSYKDAFSLNMIGELFNQFLFGATGGDMVKAYVVAVEQPGRRSAGIMSVFVDRAVGLLVLMAFALAACLMDLQFIFSRPEVLSLALLVLCAFAGSIVCGFIFYSRQIRSHRFVRWALSRLPFRSALSQISEAIYIYRFHPREVFLSVLASLAVHVCVVTMNLLLARALIPGDLPWVNFFFLIPLAQIAMAIPINPPGALGTAEGVYGYLLHLAGLEQGALVCLLQRVTYYLWALLGCYCYVKRKVKVAEAVEAVRQEEKELGEGAREVAVAPAAAVEP